MSVELELATESQMCDELLRRRRCFLLVTAEHGTNDLDIQSNMTPESAAHAAETIMGMLDQLGDDIADGKLNREMGEEPGFDG